MDYLLDTNHASRLLEGNNSISAKINALKNNGSGFGISISILGELFFAVYASRRKDENLHQLKDFLDDVIIWGYDIPAPEDLGKSRLNKKQKANPFLQLMPRLQRLHEFTTL